MPSNLYLKAIQVEVAPGDYPLLKLEPGAIRKADEDASVLLS